MKKQLVILAAVLFLVIPFSALAMKSMDHSQMNKADSMAMGGNMIMLQDIEVDGVMASAHLLDTREKMAKHGMKETHHFMVGFTDKANKATQKGQVAVKIEAPDGAVSGPIGLMRMGDSFGADVALNQKGMYQIMVGTKLEDGKKRTFHMHFDNK